MLGNALWRAMFRLPLSAAEKKMRALAVYLFLSSPLRVFGKA